MAEIHILSSNTINKIAAGEVVERPVNVVKELVENAIDAGSTAITVEIKNGGIDMIRVTDNGCGIEPSQLTKAFRRHATSKITDAEDLNHLVSLGFRGEALSSIAAVSQVEMITKTRESIVGTRAVCESEHVLDTQGMQTSDVIPLDISEIGAPDGTSVIVRNIFYNVPVRKKFLKAPQTEAGYITDLVQHLALSHPDVSFHYRVNGQDKLHTTGNKNEKELIYRIYGREMANSVIPIRTQQGDYVLEGYLGRPEFSRASRNFELFFVNGRILKSDILSKSLEEGYRTDLMQHRFPFAILHLSIPASEIDVNVHPTKMEVRFANGRDIYDFINESVHQTLHKVELIPRATFSTEAEERVAQKAEVKEREASFKGSHQEPFEMPNKAATSVTPASMPAQQAPQEQKTVQQAAPAQTPLSQPAQQKQPAQQAALHMPKASDFAPFIHAIKSQEPVTSAAGTADPLQTAAAKDPAGAPLAQTSEKESSKDDFFFEDTRPAPAGTFQQATLFAQETLPEAPKDADIQKLRDDDELAAAAYIAAAAKEAGDTTATADYADSAYGNDLHYHLLSDENRKHYNIIGQIFKTYWLIEFQDKLLMIDQHAAHEKVNFERLMKRLAKEQETQAPSQMLAPPIIVSMTGKEEAAYEQFADVFTKMGYEIEPFGDGSYAMRAVPLELYANKPDDLFREILDEILSEKVSGTPAAILYKIASMSCKAAVKGNQNLSAAEAKQLIDELLTLDNPYHCPHGRPTMIVLSQKELEKKFKRIV